MENESSDPGWGSAQTTPKGEPSPRVATRRANTCVKVRVSPRTRAAVPATAVKKRAPAEGGDAVKVYVRVKPLLPEDIQQGRAVTALSVRDAGGKPEIVLGGGSKEHQFSDFDGVLDDATNQQVFDAVFKGMWESFLRGINVSIMAYGQTGSGKTHTMFGQGVRGGAAQQGPALGMLHLALRRLGDEMWQRSPLDTITVSVFEVYNEDLFSLLGKGGVERRHLGKGKADYRSHEPLTINNVDDAIAKVMAALANRAQDATNRNATSSRSHAFVKITLTQLSVKSTLLLVDLAGSESYGTASKAGETIGINSALHHLEVVFNSLITRTAHVPYRNSVLTQALEEGLDPHKARVALLATVNRLEADHASTKSTLVFAQRARAVCTYAQVNHAPKRAAPSCEDLQRRCNELGATNYQLRQALADVQEEQEHAGAVQRQHAAMQEQLQQQADMQQELQATCRRLQAEVEAAGAALDVERRAHADTREREAAERAAHATTRERVEVLQRELAALQREADEAAAAAAAAERAGSRERVEVLEQELAALQQTAEAEARAASQALAEARVQLSAAQTEAARAGAELVGARQMLQEVEQHKAQAQEQLVQARAQVTKLKGQVAGLEAAAAESEQQLAAASTASSSREHALAEQLAALRASAKAEREAAEAAAANVESRTRALQEQLGAAQQQAEQRLLQQVAEAEAQADGRLREVQAQVAEAEAQAAQHKQQAAEWEMQQGRLQGAAAKAESQCVALQEQLAASNNQLEVQRRELEAQAAAAAAAAESHAAEVRELEARLHSAEARAQQLGEQLEQESPAGRKAADEHAAMASNLAKAEGELAGLQAQLAEQAAAARQQANAHAAALTAAVQEARAASQAAAGQKLLPLQTECERLRATCSLQEQQLGRLQAEVQRQREAGEAAEARAAQAEAAGSAARAELGDAQRALAEAGERAARLEAQVERDVGPRRDARHALEERVKQLLVQLKEADEDFRKKTELKDKQIHRLQAESQQHQMELERLRQDTALAPSYDQLAGYATPFTGGVTPARTESTFATPYEPLGAACTPGSAIRATPGSAATPSMFLGRTTTQGAAALRRNTRTTNETPTPATAGHALRGPGVERGAVPHMRDLGTPAAGDAAVSGM